MEFFGGRIANDRTRSGYARAAGQFLGWCEGRGHRLEAVSPLHVAAYIRMHPGSAPTVKQHLAATRMLCDWLVVSQVLPVNSAAAVRGPKHVVPKGATPVLSPAEARNLLEHIETGAVAGMLDRALLSVMLYSFARVSAVLGMRRQNYFGQACPALGGASREERKRHDVPAHHRAAAALDEYVKAAELEEPKAALFQSVHPAGWPADGAGARAAGGSGDDQTAGVRCGAAALDVLPHVTGDGDHSLLIEQGTLERAQQLARHASPNPEVRPPRS